MNTVTLDIDTLERAFRPRSVAILGAASDPKRISGRPLHYMKLAGYKGAIYPINNRRDEVQGLKAYPSLAEVPEVPDMALIALGAGHIKQAVQDCVDKGVGAAVIFAAGFAETGEEGRAAQDEIVAIARSGGLRLFGPNCLGVFHTASGFIGTFTSGLDNGFMKPGNVAIVSQSGAYGGHLAYLCRERNIGVGYWASTGNEADTDLPSCIEWLARQDDVSVIMAYAEGIRDGARFERALKVARDHGKPIVFMKVGESDVGAAAAASHTASLAGSDSVYDALFRQYGVYRARTTEEQVDVAYAAARGIYPAGSKIGIVTVSGGFGIQLCDAAERVGLEVPPMPATAQAKLKEANPFGGLSNPCDTTSNFINDMGILRQTYEIMYAEGGYDSVIGAMTILPGSQTFGEAMRDAITEGTRAFRDRPTVMCMEAPAPVVQAYDDAGFITFPDSERAVRAISALIGFREAFENPVAEVAVDRTRRVDLPRGAMSEAGAQKLLSAAGVPFLPQEVVADADAAAATAARIGFPVVMKIVSPDILHKTEIGGVILNVDSEAAAREAHDTLVDRAARKAPGARIEGVLVARMAPKGIETILGVTNDPVFGPVVMFGLGGIFTELFKDVTFRLAPFDTATAHAMMREIKGFPLLEGFRGAPGADLDSLAALLADLSQFAAANAADLESIDLNPVLALPDGVVALDAVIETRGQD
ncbi:acetate--CoA ligase family protein [Salipiger sp.]|uniref:acetate--CoA ligase family protein n=1 Tax=Salipiger sp. TaxID=2078585 RepID=UPI003A9820D1